MSERLIDLVLGAGPVGLIAAYLRGGLCVGLKVGGGDLRRYAPTFLWRTEATEVLLTELDLPWEPRTVRFGYLGDAGVLTTFGERDRLEYYRRSRGIAPDAPVGVPRSVMSGGLSGEIPTFNVSVEELVEALLGQVEVVQAEVKAIGFEGDGLGRRVPKVRVVLDKSELLNKIVVNTLPAPVFDRLLVGVDRMKHFRPTHAEWKAGVKTFHRWRVSAMDELIRTAFEEGYAYLYVVSKDRERYPFDRVTFVKEGGEQLAVLEYNWEGPMNVKPTHGLISGAFQVLGPSRDPVEFGGAVRHVGRLARWRHDVRLHDVVSEMYDD